MLLLANSVIKKDKEPKVRENKTGGQEYVVGGDKNKTDQELIKQALVDKYDGGFTEMVVTVSQNDGQYATGSVGSADPMGGGGAFFAAKVGGLWEIVWDGNGFVMCEDLVGHEDFPTSLIPECYNFSTDKIIER